MFKESEYSYIDVRKNLDNLMDKTEIPTPAPFILQPGQFILASTVEYIGLANNIVARLEGKSSLGRLGILIHSTAGYVDPGWKGTLTLEISSVARIPITLYYGMEIGQISFLRLSTPSERPYGSVGLGSKYQGQVGATATRIKGNFDFDLTPQRKSQAHHKHNHDLRDWLSKSQFNGNVKDFAQTLGITQKTVEDWVYGRYKPSQTNKAKLFEITGLQVYNSNRFGTQQHLIPTEDD